MHGDAQTLDELVSAAVQATQELVKPVKGRHSRDAVLTSISDAHAALAILARRIGGAGHGFSERAVRGAAEDRDDDDAEQRALDRAQVDVSLDDVLVVERTRVSAVEVEVTRRIQAKDEGDGAEVLHEFVRAKQLTVLRSMINYIWHTATNPWQMMKRALAVTRRYQRTKIKGISMTEVARLLGEKSRCAAVSARERDVHDVLLRRWDIRAPKAADGGLRSESTCEKNRRAALGNTNRRKAQPAVTVDAALKKTRQPFEI